MDSWCFCIRSRRTYAEISDSRDDVDWMRGLSSDAPPIFRIAFQPPGYRARVLSAEKQVDTSDGGIFLPLSVLRAAM